MFGRFGGLLWLVLPVVWLDDEAHMIRNRGIHLVPEVSQQFVVLLLKGGGGERLALLLPW